MSKVVIKIKINFKFRGLIYFLLRKLFKHNLLFLKKLKYLNFKKHKKLVE